jgi:DNA-binding transcriptional ArsR family regulator
MSLHGTLNYAFMNQRILKRQRHDPRVDLLRELADPIRLRVVDRLGHGGPATVSRLGAELDVPLPQLSNHLRRLREAGLVTVERQGRRAIYALADPGLEALLPLLDRITGRVLAERPAPGTDPRPSRTCYDHLGGTLGVTLYRALSERQALRDRPDGTVELGPAGAQSFAALGVDAPALRPGRQRFAFECLDATEHAPHLAGALGDALAAALLERAWIEREPGGRTIAVTPAGARGLEAALGVRLAA